LQRFNAFGFYVDRDAVEHHVWRIRAASELHATSSGAFSQAEQQTELVRSLALPAFTLLS